MNLKLFRRITKHRKVPTNNVAKVNNNVFLSTSCPFIQYSHTALVL